MDWLSIIIYFAIGWGIGWVITKMIKGSTPLPEEENNVEVDSRPELRLTVEVRNGVIYFYELPSNRFIAQARTADEFIDHLTARGLIDHIYLMSPEDIAKVPWLAKDLNDVAE